MTDLFARRAALVAALLSCGLVACSGDPDEPAGDPAADTDATVPAGSQPVEPSSDDGWRFDEAGEQSAQLSFADAGSGTVLTLRCLPDPARLQVEAPYLMPIGSEERLTFGVGGRLVAMVAEPAAGLGDMEERGVVAETPLEPELVAALSGGDVGLSYGAEILEIEQVPADADLTRFANSCEAALSNRAATEEAEELRAADPE
ncbi:hypothetical protein B5C34_13805 [Pacificimonas flava]|uniref:Lipoprotein n=2 Tax=Pacificimonas TaxID=1960290 RepID=A0A219B8G8_9SPHN|nr:MULTISPECIES: hypothetical protein [Pacificimonas]MBZ6379900.1 hypothetical protein [Pacificimonas aurantium]OWV34426.1 hypothetical protein B5C34_13805 [Pacificimonas flava]